MSYKSKATRSPLFEVNRWDSELGSVPSKTIGNSSCVGTLVLFRVPLSADASDQSSISLGLFEGLRSTQSIFRPIELGSFKEEGNPAGK